MLLYVIPFILLLVVAIVLKKREDANKDGASAKKVNRTNNKKATKKNVARTARTSSQRQQSSVVEDTVVIKQITKPLSADLKKSIEQLIAEKNYFSAEAKINQSLNQDNSQHELYLYLLDVHLAQKDEFAVGQLINHIRSLGLDDIVAQAEEKQKAAQVDKPIESIAFVSPTTTPTAEAKKDTTAFDELIGGTTPAASIADVLSQSSPQSNNEALEFTSSAPAPKPAEEVQPLEFNLDPKHETPPVQPLEFSLASDTDLPVEKELTPVEQVEAKVDPIAPLEFSFTPEATPVEKAPEVEAPEFKLDFAEPTPTAPVAEEVEFKFTPEPEVQPTLSFDLDPKTEVFETAPTTQTETLPTEAPATQVETNLNDPLIQSFPELAQVNEIQLNLELAQQYISLGAYASARELLAQDEATYTPQQREQSQSLLNQIAS